MKIPSQENTLLKVSMVVQDTWAIWHEEDTRGLSASKFDPEKLKDWYGCNSKKWKALLKRTNSKPEIVFFGKDPGKRNKNYTDGNKLSIQCFHSNSSMDLLIKGVLENSCFRGSYMTDVFDKSFEERGETISLKDIKKKYKTEWEEIRKEAQEKFVKLIMDTKCKDIIAFGNDAFEYIQEFTKDKFQTSDMRTLENKIESITLKESNRKWSVFKVYHPSPLNRNRHKLSDQMKYLAKEIQVLR